MEMSSFVIFSRKKIENGTELFYNCARLDRFDSDLSSLSEGNLMFFNCNLDAYSVERILTTIPTYTSGVHNLTISMQDSASDKFSEIVGVNISENVSIAKYKGWTITVVKLGDREVPTDYDIWKNVVTVNEDMEVIISNLFVPDASQWNEKIINNPIN